MSQNKNPSVSFPSSTLIIFFTNIAWWWYVFWLVLNCLITYCHLPLNLTTYHLFFFINSSFTVCVKGVCILFYFSNKKKWTAFDLATVLIVRVLLLSFILIRSFEGTILLSYVLASTNVNSDQKEAIVTDQCCSLHFRV